MLFNCFSTRPPIVIALKEAYPQALKYRAKDPKNPDVGLADYLVTAATEDKKNGGDGDAVAFLDSFGNLLMCKGGNKKASPVRTAFMETIRAYQKVRYDLTASKNDALKYLCDLKHGVFIFVRGFDKGTQSFADMGAYGSSILGTLSNSDNLQYVIPRIDQNKLDGFIQGMPPRYRDLIKPKQVKDKNLIRAVAFALGIANDRCIKLKNVVSTFKKATHDSKTGNSEKKKPKKETFNGHTYTGNIVANHIQGFTCYNSGNLSKMGFLSHSTSSDKGDYMTLYQNEHLKFKINLEKDDGGGYNHPGGLQLIGDYAVVPIENKKSSYIYAFDLSSISKKGDKPSYFPLQFIDGEDVFKKRKYKAGVIGIANYTDLIGTEKYLLVTYDNKNKLTYYLADVGSGLKEARFKETHSETISSKHGSFHGISLLTETPPRPECTSPVPDKMFLVGFSAKSTGSYADYISLYEINLKTFKVSPVNNLCDLHMCTSGGGTGGVHFRWGASAYAYMDTENNDVIELYASARLCIGNHLTYNTFSSKED